MAKFGEIGYADTKILDAFNALRVSEKRMLFQTQNQYGIDTLMMETGITATGTSTCLNPSWDANDTMVTLSSNTPGTGVCTSWIQSFQYYPYEAGFSTFAAISGTFGSGVAGWTKDYVFGDAKNGIVFRQNGTIGLEIILRSSTSGAVVETIFGRANWNIDTFGANPLKNPSGKSFDVTKGFIFGLDLQFLSMGRVRTFLDIDGVVFYFHEFLNAGNLAVPYMQTANLPLSVVLTGTSPASPASMRFKCGTIQSENGVDELKGYDFSFPSKAIIPASAAQNIKTHLCSIRPKTTFNGQTNRIMTLPTGFYIGNQSTRVLDWELALGSTYTNAVTVANIDATFSSVEYTYGGGTVISTGLVIARGSVPAATSGRVDIKPEHFIYPLTLNRAGTQRAMGTLSLNITPIGGAASNPLVDGSISFKEIRR